MVLVEVVRKMLKQVLIIGLIVGSSGKLRDINRKIIEALAGVGNKALPPSLAEAPNPRELILMKKQLDLCYGPRQDLFISPDLLDKLCKSITNYYNIPVF